MNGSSRRKGFLLRPLGSARSLRRHLPPIWLLATLRHIASVQDINAVNAGFAAGQREYFADRRLDVIADRAGFAVDRTLFYGKGGVAFREQRLPLRRPLRYGRLRRRHATP
jgi:hypothetical protein